MSQEVPSKILNSEIYIPLEWIYVFNFLDYANSSGAMASLSHCRHELPRRKNSVELRGSNPPRNCIVLHLGLDNL